MGAFDGNLIDWNANTLSKIKVTTVNTAIAQNVLTKSMSARVFFFCSWPLKKSKSFFQLFADMRISPGSASFPPARMQSNHSYCNMERSHVVQGESQHDPINSG